MYRRKMALSNAAPEDASGDKTSRPLSAILSALPDRAIRAFWRVSARKNAFIRPAVANIDQLVVLASCAIPVTEPFLSTVSSPSPEMQGVPALVVVNKDDLALGAAPCGDLPQGRRFRARHKCRDGRGDRGSARSAQRSSCLTGNSGVGIDSFLNRACPQLQLPVGEVSEKLGRGRHTTRHIELYSFGGYVRRRYSRLFRIRYRTDGTGAQGTAAICFPRVRSISWPLPVSRLCPPKRTRLRHP